MINTPLSDQNCTIDQQRFKTPLLQSILSKTRITTILNKYADDPLISSSTLSLIAQNSQTNTPNGNMINKERSAEIHSNIQDKVVDLKSSSQQQQAEDDEIVVDELISREANYELQMTEVNVVVEDSSSGSSSPSSPTSSTSSRSSQPSSPLVSTTNTSAKTQISA